MPRGVLHAVEARWAVGDPVNAPACGGGADAVEDVAGQLRCLACARRVLR